MAFAAIEATGSYVPEHAVHNAQLSQFAEGATFLIGQKTGVICRRHAGDRQCTSDLAFEAARRCIEQADFAARRLQAIIVATSSPDRLQPATATRLQYLLGAVNSFAFDINSVCSGGVFGMALCHALIRSGACRNVLLVGAEVYSKILNPKDFSTYPYFGDGAGALLFRASRAKCGVLRSILATDGSGSETICVPAGGTMLPFACMQEPKAAFFRMKGREVFEFAVEKGTDVIRRLLGEAGVPAEEIKCFICHQANVNILLKIAENLELDEERFYMNMFRYGNTAGASVLIALDEALARGVVAGGDLVVTAAFGGGLSWGANLIRL